MKERYNELKELLTTLFRQLPTPMGGSIDDMFSIYMTDSDTVSMMAITTTQGYTVVSASGEAIQCSTLKEVHKAFLQYFYTFGH